ncbi:hypothetical protein PLICRDRAFT_628228 [Plicaturopsis crispa FD-325 SS-3]|nr:hypothetical protein PLICRDRAFT_628228 [Plicaturopsis crispa FD-325 SS-3]
MDTASATNSPGSTGSASDSDAVNTTSARIYFGPLTSPEKKFVPNVARRRTLTPSSSIRRSPRLSTPGPASPRPDEHSDDSGGEQKDDDAENNREEEHERSGTPENEERFSRDEPSSVLADKIMHAHTNPSPPPTTRQLTGMDDTQPPLIDSPTPHPSYENMFAAQDDDPERPVSPMLLSDHTPPPLPALVVHEPSPKGESTPQRENTSQRDLISFDSFSSPSRSFQLPSPLAAVDDLLDRSVPAFPTVNGLGMVSAPPTETDTTPAQHLATPPIPPETDTVQRGTQDPTHQAHHTENVPRPQSRLSSPNPPVRRSARRSVTPSTVPVPSIVSADIDTSNIISTPPLEPAPSSQPAGTSLGAELLDTQKQQARGTSPVVSDSLGGTAGSSAESSKASALDLRALTPDVSGEASSEETRRRRGDKRGRADSKPEETFRKKLRSLSPESADVLTQLVPALKSVEGQNPPESPPPRAAQIQNPIPSTPKQHKPFPFPSETPRPHATAFPSTIQRPAVPHTPIRGSSPGKFLDTRNDPSRTPARRIPFEQAVAQGSAAVAQGSASPQRPMPGSASPQRPVPGKAHGTPMTRAPVFSRPDPMSSPARRVPVVEAKRMTSPIRGFSRERSGSAEPWQRAGSAEPRHRAGSVEPQQRAGSVEPRQRAGSVEQQQRPPFMAGGKDGLFQRPVPSSAPRPTTHLPFPLIPSHGVGKNLPRSIPEETEHASAPTPTPAPVPASPSKIGRMSTAAAERSPAKSSLRQPANTSRIPRIGAKPYARPATKSKLPTMKQQQPAAEPPPPAMKPMRLVRSGSDSSSDDTNAIAGPGPNTTMHARKVVDPPGGITATNLKRKRAAGPSAASPPGARPVVVIRQVVPGTIHRNHQPPTNKPHLVEHQQQPEPSPVKRHMRKVVDGVFARNHKAPEVQAAPMEEHPTSEDAEGQSSTKRDEPVANSSKKENTPPSSPVLREASAALDAHASAPDTPAGSSPADTDTDTSHTKVRRTSRLRKPVQSSDVFGSVRPLQAPRKPPSSRSEPALGGMTAIALKALTTSNTTRNQEYIAAKLETEVIRKEGARPESPTVKVRTILQRQKEEMGQRRAERAVRRARRSEDGPGGSSDHEGLGESSMAEDWEGSSQVDQNPLRHRRGPGDEEDYETPLKPERAAKRARLDENAEREREREERKGVKWDRGLYTEIYLDEIHPNPKARPKDILIKKGCLARTAKSLRLDTLGNHPYAEVPLTDLVPENVVVKKFVYDNDVEPVVTAPPVKVTRSKSKKSKS